MRHLIMCRRLFHRLIFSLLIGMLLCYQHSSASTLPLKNVTKCNVNDCQLLPPILIPNEPLGKNAIIFQTSKQKKMLRIRKEFSSNHYFALHAITVHQKDLPGKTYPIIGFGGSFTDAAAILYQHLSPSLQNSVIKAYFSQEGIGYSLARVPIASTDFSCRNIKNIANRLLPYPSLHECSKIYSPYTYADTVDLSLSNFALQAEDIEFKIPMIKAAINTAGKNMLRFFASPWSAPAWMKTNGNMVHGSINPKFQQLWANYFIKFLESYKKYDIKFWGVTVQNEPDTSPIIDLNIKWQSMFYTKQEEANFIKYYLGPTLKYFEKAYGSKIELMMHDDQITSINERMTVLADLDVSQYVSGAALHWYTNLDIFYKNLDYAFATLNQHQNSRFILATEACEGYSLLGHGPRLGSWSRGEAYAHDIISDLNHHVSGWTDWNLMLDMQGGPNWANNYVDAPLLVDIEKQTVYLQPMYYYLGHFSRFIRPGAKLIVSQSKGAFPLEEVTYKVPAHDNLPETIVIVVLNRDVTGRKYYIEDDTLEQKYLNLHIPGHSIQTIIYQASA